MLINQSAMTSENWKRFFARERQRRFRAKNRELHPPSTHQSDQCHPSAASDHQDLYHYSDYHPSSSPPPVGQDFNLRPSHPNQINLLESLNSDINCIPPPQTVQMSLTSEEWKRHYARERQRKYRAKKQQSMQMNDDYPAPEPSASSHHQHHDYGHHRSSSLSFNQNAHYFPSGSNPSHHLYDPPSQLPSQRAHDPDMYSMPSETNHLESVPAMGASRMSINNLTHQMDHGARHSHLDGYARGVNHADGRYPSQPDCSGGSMMRPSHDHMGHPSAAHYSPHQDSSLEYAAQNQVYKDPYRSLPAHTSDPHSGSAQILPQNGPPRRSSSSRISIKNLIHPPQ